jgi:hypothetical protein
MMWVLSLVVSVAMVAWWVRSYFRGEVFARVIDVVEEHDELEREWFVYSNNGQLYIACNWAQFHYDVTPPGEKTHSFWKHESFMPNPTWPGPAYSPKNVVTSTGRDRWRGFDIGIMSMGHRTMSGSWEKGWSNVSYRAVRLPHWMVELVLLILPAIALRRRMKARKRRQLVENRRCPHCGYDLRASGEFCSECGKPVEVADVGSAS